MKKNIIKNPLIAAARSENLDKAVRSNVSAVILMEVKLSYLIKEEFKKNNDNKPIFIHFDLLRGLSNDVEAVRFIKDNINPKGIVSTKSTVLNAAKKRGLMTIQRIFLIDSKSLKNSIASIIENDPDMVEVMPALCGEIVNKLKKEINKPIILGGLIDKEEQIIEGLRCGADAISFSKEALWNMKIDKEIIQ
ncbi:glycerol-3-phosphate responsive antiterminator [Terrisporobacter glycolicus]|uniref:Glycerol uptake operon antiterminator regulatory protein n=1 Tax=Terrisporobacter glycolicus ATCC 14880 = DSM 1288 TaxID=1121315 RepID=A0ABZ2ERB0_9FIRM|nr:glycerol-3-phosphate responsive antiterminator [Terrisporobacter glycolicus]